VLPADNIVDEDRKVLLRYVWWGRPHVDGVTGDRVPIHLHDEVGYTYISVREYNLLATTPSCNNGI
jgi:hypothetical protein